MKINEAFIIDFLTYKAGRPLKPKELASELSVNNAEYRQLRDLIKKMTDEGKLVKLRRGRIGIPSEMNLVVGPITISRTGYGTVYNENGEPIVVPPDKVKTALDGDKVMVRVENEENEDLYGKVIRILERAEQRMVGTFFKGKGFNYVIPDNKKIRRDIYIPNRFTKKARDGEQVLIRLTGWDDPSRNPEGEVLEKIGLVGEPGTDLLTVIKKYELPGEFPKQVNAEAEQSAEYFNNEEIKRRRNFTRETIYTIDPSDAKDHDDAITVKKTDDGYTLGVHIADVSHFVRENTILDKEAFSRANSVYLPGMVIPMLPEKLSNDLCSLKPNRRRLVYSVLINYDRKGKVLDWEITEGVINSRAKLSYEEVQEFFATGKETPRIKRVAKNLRTARELARILLKNRMAEGSLDFDLPEAKITLNNKGEIVEIANRVRLESHRLIEEFMLAANRAVALHVFRLAQKFLYRVHDKPDMEKLEAFSYLVSTLGYKFAVSPNMRPIQFSRFLEKIKGKPEEEFLNELMLRSMKKAVYQPKNIGHFGLAFSHYTHFTSPIRRYPDLTVHRLLKKLKDGKYPQALNKKLDTILANVGKHCSDVERLSEEAEREAVKIKQVAFMSKHVGDEYEGVISGILNFGFFVRLNNMGVEGMVRLSTLDDDYYNFDERHFRLVGKRTGNVFQLGDSVKVGVMQVNQYKNEIDFYLVETKRVQNNPPTKKERAFKSRHKPRRRRRKK